MGLLIEVLCFSLAIAEDTRILQKSKESTSLQLIDQLKQNQLLQLNMNQELDKKVNEKTNELIAVYSKIEKQRENQIKSDFTQKLKEMEMLALRSQMNPHFLFNSLNAIKHLIMTDNNENATHYLDDFSGLLRGILQNSNREIVTVEDELEMLELYLSLEKSRLGKNLNYTIKMTSREALSQYNIPPLLLQPFVENAIWHGLSPSSNPEKCLDITIDTSQNLIITIQDNGIGRKASAKKNSTHISLGMKITQERLSLFNHLSDSKIIVKVTDLEVQGVASGTLITITYSN
jgi:sensor histidine kinase YesM